MLLQDSNNKNIEREIVTFSSEHKKVNTFTPKDQSNFAKIIEGKDLSKKDDTQNNDQQISVLRKEEIITAKKEILIVKNE